MKSFHTSNNKSVINVIYLWARHNDSNCFLLFTVDTKTQLVVTLVEHPVNESSFKPLFVKICQQEIVLNNDTFFFYKHLLIIKTMLVVSFLHTSILCWMIKNHYFTVI